MKSLLEYLQEADEKKVAVGHFNISDLAALKAIFASAKKLNFPVIIGLSEGERDFVGVSQAAALVSSIRHEHNFPIFLNADHTHSLEKVREAAMADFDQIIFDGSSLPLEENIRQTRQAVEIAKSINPNIIMEGEIGFIGNSSEVMDYAPSGIELTHPEDAKRFIEQTGVKVLAPAVGNMHGLLKTMLSGDVQKRLNLPLIKELKEAIGGSIFMTLHGGSGTNDDDFKEAIKSGMTIVHVNTELRVAWRKGVERGLSENPNEVAPYKILPFAVSNIEKVVEKRLNLFNS